MAKKIQSKSVKANLSTSNKSASKSLRATYDAVDNRKRRKVKVTNLRSEDNVLKPQSRDQLVSDTRNLQRNYAIARFAINKHLDYVSTFTFQCRIPTLPNIDKSVTDALSDRVEGLMSWFARPENCDISGRFSLPEMIRMVERLALVDGDSFLLKLDTGKTQIVEGDRIRTPSDLGKFKGQIDEKLFTHGVQISPSYERLNYAVCDRIDARYVLTDILPAEYVYQHGHFDRYEQVRPVSPLASAINQFSHLYEAEEYALAKMKLAQLFGIKFQRADGVETDDDAEPYTFDFGGGPQAIDLDPGDDASFMESHTPSSEFQSFMLSGIQTALKSLDIPYSFFAESYANYNGSRLALLQYEQSAAIKRQRLQNLLTKLTYWRLSLWIADGVLTLPQNVFLRDIAFEWLPIGVPWLDPLKEANADKIRIDNKTASRQEICRERGKNWFDVCDQLAEENNYIASNGMSSSDSNAQAPSDSGDMQDALDRIAELENQLEKQQAK